MRRSQPCDHDDTEWTGSDRRGNKYYKCNECGCKWKKYSRAN